MSAPRSPKRLCRKDGIRAADASLQPYHVVASVISLATTFFQKSSRAHSAAPPLQMRSTPLGSHLALVKTGDGASKVFTQNKETSEFNDSGVFLLFEDFLKCRISLVFAGVSVPEASIVIKWITPDSDAVKRAAGGTKIISRAAAVAPF